MKEIVFITGVDRSGKSTLAKQFIQRGYEYKHFIQPAGSPYLEYLKFFWQIRNSTAQKWVVDRYVWCEYAYSRHYRRFSDCTLGRIRALETKFLDFDSKLVHCETDLESNWKRIVQEGKNEFSKIDDLMKLRNWYGEAMRDTVLPYYSYDFTRGDTFENLFKVKSV